MFTYSDNYCETDDAKLVEQAVIGSRAALSQLVERHQKFVYNVALKFIRDADDASDLTQEVLIKMVTKLHQFEHNSSFRTWLYRMTFNHFVNTQRKKAELEVHSFDQLAEYVDRVHNQEEMTTQEQFAYSQQIIEVRNKCMTSTLLCLNRQQRLVLILGCIFNFKSTVAAELLDMTPENFRQQLSRAKADLYNFMDNNCGLINPSNSCRCHKKTKGFIKEGLVNAKTGQFFTEITETIGNIVANKNEELDFLIDQKYLSLFLNQPYEKPEKNKELAERVLQDPLVIELFDLN